MAGISGGGEMRREMQHEEIIATGLPAIIESILFRRVLSNRLIGYTLDTSIEIAGAVLEVPYLYAAITEAQKAQEKP